MLADGREYAVGEVVLRLRMSQPAVSKHLIVLKVAGLVRDRREGRETHFSARPKALEPLTDWLGHYDAFWRDHFERLGTTLDKM